MVRAGITEAGFVLNLIVQSRMLSFISRLFKDMQMQVLQLAPMSLSGARIWCTGLCHSLHVAGDVKNKTKHNRLGGANL